MEKMRKITISMPAKLVMDLDYLAKRIGTSRSAIIAEFLADGVTHTRNLLELIPPAPTAADVVRMRGQSEQIIRDRLANLEGIAHDLFSKP